MAAELSRTADGQAHILYAGETPWHREGKRLTEAETHDFGAAVQWLDYPLEKRPCYMPDGNGGFRVLSDAYYIERTDTGKILGTVGGSYEIVPNSVAFAPLQPLVDQGLASIETGGVLRGGEDAWLMVRWNLDRLGPVTREVFGDEVLPYSAVMVGHSGKRGILLGTTGIRIVCANTMAMAETEARGAGSSRWATIEHRKGAGRKLIDTAEQMFHGLVIRYEKLAEQYRALKAAHLTDDAFAELVLDVVAPDPRKDAKFNPEAKLAHVVLERSLEKRDEVKRLWTEGKGHTGERSAWFALNGAIEALDHRQDLWPTRAGAWRTASMLTGTIAELKNRVTDSLVAYAAGIAG